MPKRSEREKAVKRAISLNDEDTPLGQIAIMLAVIADHLEVIKEYLHDVSART